MQERELTYRNEMAWGAAVSALVERLQGLGENLSPFESDSLTERFYYIVLRKSRKGVPHPDELNLLRERLISIFSSLPTGELIPGQTLVDKLDGTYSSNKIQGVMRTLGSRHGIARIRLDHAYWLKPIIKETLALPKNLEELDITSTKSSREHIVRSFRNLGYCVSPESDLQESIWTLCLREIYESKHEWCKQLHSKADAWRRDGKPLFDEIVKRTGMPTIHLKGTYFNAFVAYHPQMIIQAQRLRIAGNQ